MVRAQTYRVRVPFDASADPEPSAVPLIETDFEFPTINEARKGLPYCHVFGYENSHSSRDGGATGFASMAIRKIDTCTGKTISFSRPYHYFLEPFFVPRPGATDEDDGVVLVLAQDGRAGTGVLFALDASDLSVVATAQLPTMTTIKTHGRFLWRDALRA